MSGRHQGESGVVVEVFWPVTVRAARARVEWIAAYEQDRPAFSFRSRKFSVRRRSQARFVRGRQDRLRPFWVAMPVGDHHLIVKSTGDQWDETHDLEMTVPSGDRHLFVLCWPAKGGRFVSAERATTAWAIHTISPGAPRVT